MIFNSAGHNLTSDPGAVGKVYTEAQLTHRLRNLINVRLNNIGARYTGDKDSEGVKEYLRRIQPGDGSVVHECHFNASANKTATGVEVIIPDRHTNLEYDAAKEIALAVSSLTGIPRRGNKGVKTESDSQHKRLALMRPQGINLLSEICFISNDEDVERYIQAEQLIADRIADILKKYDDKIA